MDAMLLLSIFLPDEKQASGIMKEFEQVHQIFRFCIKSEKKKKTLKPTENLANLTIVCLHHSTLF